MYRRNFLKSLAIASGTNITNESANVTKPAQPGPINQTGYGEMGFGKLGYGGGGPKQAGLIGGRGRGTTVDLPVLGKVNSKDKVIDEKYPIGTKPERVTVTVEETAMLATGGSAVYYLWMRL